MCCATKEGKSSGPRASWPTGEAVLALYVVLYLAASLAGAPLWLVIAGGAVGVVMAIGTLIQMELKELYGRK